MSTDPDQIRNQVGTLLAELPEIETGSANLDAMDIDEIARRLEQAHAVLVQALESVEKD